MTDEQDLRERLEHLELDGNQVANVLAIIAQAIADATAEQGRRAEQLKALLVRCLPALDDHYTSDEGTDPTLRAALEAALNT
jgi:uncharacterized coiled-coil protein SlyX